MMAGPCKKMWVHGRYRRGDGKAEARPDENRGAMAFALNFTLVTFFVSRQRK